VVDFCLPPDNSQCPLALSLVDSHSNLTMVLKSELYHPNSMTEKAKAERQEVACLMEKAMAPHSSLLAWRIPGTGEPGGLPSMGSLLATVLEVQGGSESASVCPVWGLCSFPLQCFALGFLTSKDSQCCAPQPSSCSLEPLFQRIPAKASYRLKSQLLQRVHKQSLITRSCSSS